MSSSAQLQVQFESVLVSNAADLQGNIRSLIALCEELELAKEEESIDPSTDEYFFCCYFSINRVKNLKIFIKDYGCWNTTPHKFN